MRKRRLFYVVCLSLLGMLSFLTIPNVLGSLVYEKIVVAWDEEFGGHLFVKYLFLSGDIIFAREYIDWQMSRALYWFHSNFGTWVNFEVIGYVTWDSDDTYNTIGLLREAIEETGFSSGLYFNGVKATVLIAFTNQDSLIDNGGRTSPSEKALIIHHQEEWADDNVIMHELSHLYIAGPPADTPHGACLMSSEMVYIGPLIWEPFDPDYGGVLLSVVAYGAWMYFTTNWCDCCKRIMIEHMGGNYVPPDPFSGPVKIDYFATILFSLLIYLGIVVVFYLIIKKFWKGKSLRSNTNSAFCLVNLLLLFQPLKYPVNITARIYHYLSDYDHGILDFLKVMLS